MHTMFLVPAVGGLILPALVPSRGRRADRRIYWLGAGIAAVSAFFVAFPADWGTGLQLSLLVVVIVVIRAYASTPYLKINGKIYAYRVRDSQPDPQE